MILDEKENDFQIYAIKAKFYFENQQKIHVSLKSGRFYNGVIKSIGSDFVMLADECLGELPVFYLELDGNGFEPFISPTEKKENE